MYYKCLPLTSQYVIRLPVTPDRHSIFIVPDLTKDERFRESPVVKGGPSFKFYAGVPITTEKGVNIGGLGIWDTVTREPLTENQISFMTQIASTIMINLETRKHAEDRKKISRMSRGLHSFVEGKDHIVSEVLMPMPEREKPSRTSAIIQDATIVEEEVSDSYRNIQKIIRGSVSGDQQSSGSESDASRLSKKPQEKKEQTLCRAVNLLRDSLNLQSSGGVVFLDTSVMTRHSELRYVDHLAVEDTTDINSSAQNSDFGTKDDILATVLAKSDAILLNPQSTSCSIPQKQLQKLIRRYPRGKMWSFDEEALLSSSEEEQSSQSPQLKSSRVSDSSARLRLRQSEARMLQSAFPNAHCIMFVPLWDSALSKYGSTCFCFSTSLFQSFNQADDLTYIKAFSNSVSAEISRLATIDADQKKSDFIGSISHELRSPLHGVLASAEFLSETDCDAFQTSLIDTIDSCGRTLLDTINHVLDYSRINAFEKTWKRKRRLKYGKHGEAPAPLPGLLSIFCKTDVAAVTEEVVEGIFAGQVYSGTSSADISELSSTTNTRRLDRTASQPSPTMAGKKGPQVEVVIDISAGNFSFQTQPGAIRRVIMNIFVRSSPSTYVNAGQNNVSVVL